MRSGVSPATLRSILDSVGMRLDEAREFVASFARPELQLFAERKTGKGRKTNRDYIGNILESKHGSVIEHAVWTFLITNVSRSLKA